MGIENQYLGNPNLKKAFVSQEFTKENILEFQKCMNDPQYFIEKYIKIAIKPLGGPVRLSLIHI